MTRFHVLGAAGLLAVGAAAFAAATPAGGSDDDSRLRKIAMRDDCDPKDPAWAGVGGCALHRGDVSLAEFAGETDSPLGSQ